jgi:hypothetical protein
LTKVSLSLRPGHSLCCGQRCTHIWARLNGADHACLWQQIWYEIMGCAHCETGGFKQTNDRAQGAVFSPCDSGGKDRDHRCSGGINLGRVNFGAGDGPAKAYLCHAVGAQLLKKTTQMLNTKPDIYIQVIRVVPLKGAD